MTDVNAKAGAGACGGKLGPNAYFMEHEVNESAMLGGEWWLRGKRNTGFINVLVNNGRRIGVRLPRRVELGRG